MSAPQSIKVPPISSTPPLSYSLCTSPHVSSSYSFCCQSNPTPLVGGRPPISAEIGPDPRNANANLHLDSVPSIDAGNGVLLDFNHGFRVRMPLGNGSYRLRVCDADTQTLIADMDVSGGALAVGDRKYFIRYHLEVIDKSTNTLIASHDYNCENMPVMIVIPDGGLGDNLAWVPYAEEFRKKYHARVTCVCGEWLSRIIRDQYPELNFASVANIPNSRIFYASYFCAIFPAERKSWRPCDHQNFGMQGTIAKILGVEPVPRKVRFPYYPERSIKEPYVCISALATNPSKYWNYADGWNILCRYLKRLGYRVFVIDRDHDLVFDNKVYSVPAEAEDCTGLKPITERMAMLQHAEFFVGLPSGLSWLAWNCNIPVVMISGFTIDGSEFPTPYRVFNQNFCHGCWNDSNLFFDALAPVWCPRHVGTPREIECTRVITPKMVIDAVNRIPSVARRLRPVVTFALSVQKPQPSLFADMLQSVIERAQEYENAQFLVRCSTENPGCRFQLEEAARKNPGLIQVEYIEQMENRSTALRNLLASAQGKYFIPVEENALMLPFDLLRIIKRLEEHTDTFCSYGKTCFFSANGPEGVPQGAFYSPFQSLYSNMQMPSGVVFRTDKLKECGAWQEHGFNLFAQLALSGNWEYEPEVRTLVLHGSTAQEPSNEENLKKLIAPYNEIVSQLEKGVLPENQAGIPLAALAGAVYFLHLQDTALSAKLLEQCRARFPFDSGVRMLWLQHLAQMEDTASFKREWDAAIHDFPNTEMQYSILSPSIALIQARGLFSQSQRNNLQVLCDQQKKTPGAVIDAWNNILAPKKAELCRCVKPVRISVIIAVFRGRYIADCVHSVVEAFASYGQTEILLCNDASPEPELDIRLQMLQAENPDMIRLLRNSSNLGVALTRQEMLKHVNGDYILSFDHDDIMLPFDVKKVVDFMDANPQYAASYAPKYLFNEKGYMNDIHGSEFSQFQCFFAPKVNINAAFLRREDLMDAGGFMQVHGDKNSPADDIYLYTRLFQKKDVYFDPEARALYRMHATQITHGDPGWDNWITQQPCDKHPDLVKRILAGDIPDPCGPDFRIVRGLMGAMLFFHQNEPNITEPIIQAAMKFFPEDPGVPDARLRLFRMQNRLKELLEYYPKALEQFKDTLLPRIVILTHVLSAMQASKMKLPPDLVKLHTELSIRYHKLSPIAKTMFQRMGF